MRTGSATRVTSCVNPGSGPYHCDLMREPWGSLQKAGGSKGPSSDDNPHACGAAACKGPSPITKARPLPNQL